MYTSSQLAKVLCRQLKREGASSGAVLANFTTWLEVKNLSQLLGVILWKTKKMIAREAEAQKVVIKTSHQLSPATQNKIKTLVGAQADSPAVEVIDPELIGGFTASFSYFLYDASLKRKLKDLESALIK